MKYESRKFIDLILTATSKWANWNPLTEISVGDYGTVDRCTGKFEWEGNIYSDDFQAQLNRSPYKVDSFEWEGNIYSDDFQAQLNRSPYKVDSVGLQDERLQPVHDTCSDDEYIVCPNGTARKASEAGLEALQGTVDVKLRVNFQFDHKIGASLVMYKPQNTSIPKDERLTRLLRAMPGTLKAKHLVTEVTSCPSYVMVMSSQSAEGEHISASLAAKVPQPGITVGGAAVMDWTSDEVHGIRRSGSDTKAIYCPLYTLRKPPRTFWLRLFDKRGNSSDVETNELVENWAAVQQPPWDPIDEDGDEDEIYDAALEGEELDWEI
ncbi:hypothetical protein BS17DRAFT_810126 [Gyrodon lividus]|nr:hypothetical protein BS17DRAFT_810126 [Gyrodon lividus]